jgi:hypothetical protein
MEIHHVDGNHKNKQARQSYAHPRPLP